MRRRSKIFSSPNGFKIFKVPIPWAFAFGLDSREVSTPHEFEGATVKVDCVAFSRRANAKMVRGSEEAKVRTLKARKARKRKTKERKATGGK